MSHIHHPLTQPTQLNRWRPVSPKQNLFFQNSKYFIATVQGFVQGFVQGKRAITRLIGDTFVPKLFEYFAILSDEWPQAINDVSNKLFSIKFENLRENNFWKFHREVPPISTFITVRSWTNIHRNVTFIAIASYHKYGIHSANSFLALMQFSLFIVQQFIIILSNMLPADARILHYSQ